MYNVCHLFCFLRFCHPYHQPLLFCFCGNKYSFRACLNYWSCFSFVDLWYKVHMLKSFFQVFYSNLFWKSVPFFSLEVDCLYQNYSSIISYSIHIINWEVRYMICNWFQGVAQSVGDQPHLTKQRSLVWTPFPLPPRVKIKNENDL
jgi:hypothetical protein